ncbi:MAG: hypothetical protein H7281_06735 [Bacteriovorax sp.]|nr:hypothetical protein [Bacteriovorax sp.]
MNHPDELKNKVLEMVHQNPDFSNRKIATHFKISHRAVNLWISKCEELPMSYKNRPNKDVKWTAKQKFDAVLKFEKLPDDEQGAFLREHGLYLAQIGAWKDEMLEGLEHPKNLTDKEMKVF